jgi:hypothetical protein
MIRWLFRLVLLAGALSLGVWGWHLLFPGPEQAIRKRLVAVARAASISPGQGIVPRAANLATLRSFFADDVEVKADFPGQRSQVLNGREELMDLAAAVKARFTKFKVELVDIDIALTSSGRSAIAHLTAKLDLPGQNMPDVQPLKVGLKQVDGEWLITRVETEKALR